MFTFKDPLPRVHHSKLFVRNYLLPLKQVVFFFNWDVI